LDVKDWVGICRRCMGVIEWGNDSPDLFGDEQNELSSPVVILAYQIQTLVSRTCPSSFYPTDDPSIIRTHTFALCLRSAQCCDRSECN